MTVHCPHCLTGYLLPEHLLGEHGARVRCPGCDGVFVVMPERGSEARAAGAGEPPPPEPAPGEGSRSDPAPGAGDAGAAVETAAPAAVAGEILAVLADFLGDDLSRARSRGTVLSQHGPAILAVWDEYRRRLGADAPSLPFREALRDRCGVDLSRVNGS